MGQTECSAQGCPRGPDLPTSCLVPSPVISTSPAVTGTLRHPARPVSRPLKWTAVRLTEASGSAGSGYLTVCPSGQGLRKTCKLSGCKEIACFHKAVEIAWFHKAVVLMDTYLKEFLVLRAPDYLTGRSVLRALQYLTALSCLKVIHYLRGISVLWAPYCLTGLSGLTSPH